MSRIRLAVLGGGIMGVMTALFAARRGINVVLFDKNSRVLQGASRFNEGKIHLGCLYSASRSLETAQRLLPGGLQFQAIIEDILEQPIGKWISPEGDIYAVHQEGAVDAGTVSRYLKAISEMISDHPDKYWCRHEVSAERFSKLEQSEKENLFSSNITDAFRTPEHSVATQPLANLLEVRVKLDDKIELLTDHTVVRARRAKNSLMDVETNKGNYQSFDSVVNALWEGRPIVDMRSVGHTDLLCHHRFRLSAFVTNHSVAHPSVVVCAGPFGDLKNYGNGKYYVSWYPAGLLATGEDVLPPAVEYPSLQEAEAIYGEIAHGLDGLLPGSRELLESASERTLGGGWVYAQASGTLNDPDALLHHRNLLGVRRFDRYFSVDTGKYSTAPLMARTLAASLAA